MNDLFSKYNNGNIFSQNEKDAYGNPNVRKTKHISKKNISYTINESVDSANDSDDACGDDADIAGDNVYDNAGDDSSALAAINIKKTKKTIKKKNIYTIKKLRMNASNDDNSATTNKYLPWIEKYRPNEMSGISSHEHITFALKNFIKSKSFPHMLFYGPPGTGKTSTIISCARELYKKYYPYMVLEFNASDERGVDVVRDKIKTFVSSKNFFCDGFKLVILDETDAMTYDAQRILRQVIEKYSFNARFCLICNYISKIIQPLQSRCIKFRFAPLLHEHLYNKLNSILDAEKIKYTGGGINTIIELCNGDLRRAINFMQITYMTYSEITEQNVYNATNNYEKDDIQLIFKWFSTESFKTCYNNIQTFKNIKKLEFKNLLNAITIHLVNNNDIDIEKKKIYFDKLANIEHNEAITSNDKIQLAALISIFN